MRCSFCLPLLALCALALPARAQSVDVPLSASTLVALGEQLQLTPPALIADLVEGATLVQGGRGGGRKAQGGGGGGGSRVRVGAVPVSRGGASPMGKPFGIGLELGAPTSLTLKYMLTPDQGIVGGLGAFGGGLFRVATISLYADYLWHPHVLVWTPPFKLSWFIGGGAWVVFGDNLASWVPGYRFYFGYSPVWLAGRLPIGIDLALNELPIEFYAQLVPSLFVFPNVTLGIGGSLGFRFYF